MISRKTVTKLGRNIEITIQNFEKMGMETSYFIWENSSHEDISHTKFMFRASLISLTKNVIKLVDSPIHSFIWKGKNKIKHLALIKGL